MKPAPAALVWIALGVVYVVWGSTYLAIRVVVETMPPLLSAGVRFLIAGSVFYVFLGLKRGWASVRITKQEAAASFAIGAALLLGGNGMVTLAETNVPSGLASLIIASIPLWVVLFRMTFRERVGRGTLIGVAAGFAGVGLLVAGGSAGTGAKLSGLLTLVFAAFCWAGGSFFSKKVPLPKDHFVSTAVQMIGGGVLLLIVAGAKGEFGALDIGAISTASWVGLVYLIVFGSWLAFTAYVWLLQHAPVSKVATYAYVNPVIAIFLGWFLLSETITPRIFIGAAIIVGSVAATVRQESVLRRQPMTEGAATAEAAA